MPMTINVTVKKELLIDEWVRSNTWATDHDVDVPVDQIIRFYGDQQGGYHMPPVDGIALSINMRGDRWDELGRPHVITAEMQIPVHES